MMGSKNSFFFQSPEILELKKVQIETLLKIKGYASKEAEIYLNAYDFFCVSPNQYDGATIVKDLVDIPGLDLDAMLHDYHYLVFNCASNLKYKFKADWIYTKGMERKGKGSYSCFSRFVGLTTVGWLFVVYARIKRGKINYNQKLEIDKHYKSLIR